MMLAFVFLTMTGFGSAQYLSIAFIQSAVAQVELAFLVGLLALRASLVELLRYLVSSSLLPSICAWKGFYIVPSANVNI
jgi:hypothetical protein